MSPPATATARSRRATSPDVEELGDRYLAQPAEAPRARPPLRVVEHEPRHRGRPGHSRSRRVAPILSIVLVVGSLMAAVVGHALLAEGQIRLSAVQSAVAAAQTVNRQETVSVAELETPSRIFQEARQQLGMVSPGQVDQLPTVPLGTPLPTPTVSPAPAATPTGVVASSPAVSPGTSSSGGPTVASGK